ncbi:interferon-induced 35 kDa protein isoform X2 [Sinocyclocheilus anshuiensis]|uniref:interferon-induced 35 kDa protein isoform X2 n=1 Tax=Sinocyclocheilus anshuiensis TaxID=1608454 RepID=UPI0007BA5250|nr:PREDICTED: interferon-induced 35 kDa protein homolog isoform X2 [Sinocyclocheilus anshuiensis]
MSTEDFSLMDGQSLGCLDHVLREINKYKTQHEALLAEQKILRDGIDNNNNFAEQFKKRSEERKASIEDEKKKRTMIIQKEKKCRAVQDENTKLQVEILKVKEELHKLDQRNTSLKKQTEISTAVPERRVVFRGNTKEGAHAVSFDVNPHIVYPMEGGTALITFEEENVAQKILNLKDHLVQLGDCTITVQAKPIQFLVPSYVEMETQVCPRRILVSNLPKEEPEDRVLDKLDIHFSRKKNGGGEVEDRDMLHDSGTVVITFVDDNIAKCLSDKQDHEVDFGKKKYKVKVTPFLNGEISQMKICNSVCMRTVLLTGIPDIMDKDNLQDNLEIHFQKMANGGGEVEGIMYNPPGHTTLALFDEDSPKDS